MAELNSRTPGGTLTYCDYLTDKGYATSAQVNPWRTAVQKVFETVEGESWESLDLTSIDLDDYLSRFQTLAGAQYKAESITAYKRRIRNAVDAHEHYIETGRPPTFRQGARKAKAEGKPTAQAETVVEATPNAGPSDDGLIDYPFVLKNGRRAILRLPARITSDDANRLSALLRMLQEDQPEQRQIPETTGEDAQKAA
jgi:hypothetical protein